MVLYPIWHLCKSRHNHNLVVVRLGVVRTPICSRVPKI